MAISTDHGDLQGERSPCIFLSAARNLPRSDKTCKVRGSKCVLI